MGNSCFSQVAEKETGVGVAGSTTQPPPGGLLAPKSQDFDVFTPIPQEKRADSVYRCKNLADYAHMCMFAEWSPSLHSGYARR